MLLCCKLRLNRAKSHFSLKSPMILQLLLECLMMANEWRSNFVSCVICIWHLSVRLVFKDMKREKSKLFVSIKAHRKAYNIQTKSYASVHSVPLKTNIILEGFMILLSIEIPFLRPPLGNDDIIFKTNSYSTGVLLWWSPVCQGEILEKIFHLFIEIDSRHITFCFRRCSCAVPAF